MLIKLIPKSEFGRNVLTLMTGTSIAQAIPILISPILTRLYTPEDFGVFALYMAISGMIGVAITGRYELAIMLPKKDSNAGTLVISSITISFFISILTLCVVAIFKESITTYLGVPTIKNWLYVIPFSVFLTGVYQSLYYWCNRKKQFSRLAKNKVIQTASSSSAQIGFGAIHAGYGGLIGSSIIGQIVATVYLGKMAWKEDISFFLKKSKLKLNVIALLKHYKRFPIYSAPMGILNTLSSNLLVFFLTTLFGSLSVGFYSMALRATGLPLGIISSAFSSVFFEKIINTKNKKSLYLKSFFLNALLATVLLAPIIFWGPFIFLTIFGPNWVEAGEMASILAPFLIVNFAVGSVSTLFSALNRNDISLYWQIAQLVQISCVLLIYKFDIYKMLSVYVISSSLMYLLLFLIGLYLLKELKQ